MNVVVSDNNVLQGIFQDEKMKQAFSAYPELLCIDATYKAAGIEISSLYHAYRRWQWPF